MKGVIASIYLSIVLGMTVLFVVMALAQPQALQEYVPPDQELWTKLSTDLFGVAMPGPAHQQVQAILQNIEQLSRQRAAAKKEAKPDAK